MEMKFLELLWLHTDTIQKFLEQFLGDCYYHVRIQQPLKFIHYSTQ